MHINKLILSIGLTAFLASASASAKITNLSGFSSDNIKHTVDVVSNQNKIDVEAHKENNKAFRALKNIFTKKYVRVEDAIVTGGLFEDPFQKGEKLFISIDKATGSSALNIESYENKLTYHDLNDTLNLITRREKMAGTEDEGHTFFFSNSINGVDIINLDTEEIEEIAKDVKVSPEEKHLLEMYIFFHEYAHSRSHQEKTEFVGNKTMNECGKLIMSKESFADSYSMIELAKYIKSNVSDDEAKEVFDNVFEKVFKWRLRNSIKIVSRDIYPKHASVPTLYTTKKFINENFKNLGDYSARETNQIAAVITNRTLNHKKINKYMHHPEDMEKFLKDKGVLKRSLKAAASAVLDELDGSIAVGKDNSHSFIYNSNNESDILKGKPEISKHSI